jgi:alpha-tubulin suppressor-like RCC1 family protein
VWAWGYNGSGQLGSGDKDSSPVPEQVAGLTGITQVAAGFNHSLALRSDGTVWAWGSGIIQVAGGDEHAVALLANGTVEDWGDNQEGQLGNGTTSTDSLVPVPVSGLTSVTQVSAGGDTSEAVHTFFGYFL